MLTETAPKTSTPVETTIEELRKALIGRGMHLRIGRNFRTLVTAINSSADRGELHEQFDPDGDMDGAKDAFWVCGYDQDGELVHTQAAHLLNLQSSSIAEHIATRINHYFPKSPPVRRRTIRTTPGPKAKKLNGMIAYHGEMWLASPYRDRSTASLVNRLGLMLILREWDPDGIFGLMNWKLAAAGFNTRIGYTHWEPMTLAWDRADVNSQHQIWLVYLEREDANFLLNLPAVEYASALERNFA